MFQAHSFESVYLLSHSGRILLVTGPGSTWATNPEVQIGPAVSKAELEKDFDYVEVGKSEGAKIASGGKWPILVRVWAGTS